MDQKSPQLNIAPLRLRLASSILDTAIWIAPLLPILAFSLPSSEETVLVVSLIALAGSLLYRVVSIVWFGKTIGDALFSLKVLLTSGQRVEWRQASIRLLVDVLPSYGADELAALRNPSKQTWHDILADTVVVQEHRLSSLQNILLWFTLSIIFPAVVLALSFVIIASHVRAS